MGIYWEFLEPWQAADICMEMREKALGDAERRAWENGRMRLIGGPYGGARIRVELSIASVEHDIELPEPGSRVAIYTAHGMDRGCLRYVRSVTVQHKRYEGAKKSLSGVIYE
jgi:hypothetical protein